MKTSDFNQWDRVLYVPTHANGDVNHKDSQNGLVYDTNDKFVFVRYVYNGLIGTGAVATNPEDLRHW